MLDAGIPIEQIMDQTDHLSRKSLDPYLDNLDSSRERIAAAIGGSKKRAPERDEEEENAPQKLFKASVEEPPQNINISAEAVPSHLFSSKGIVIHTMNVYYGAPPSSM